MNSRPDAQSEAKLSYSYVELSWLVCGSIDNEGLFLPAFVWEPLHLSSSASLMQTLTESGYMRHRITLVPSVLFYHLRESRDVTTSPLTLSFDQAFLEFALHKSLLLHFSLADGSFIYPLVVLKSAAASSLVPVPGFQ